jgi:hypothetical protein
MELDKDTKSGNVVNRLEFGLAIAGASSSARFTGPLSFSVIRENVGKRVT